MLQRLSTTLLRSNKQLTSVVAKRNYQGILYQFSPPKNKLSTGELVAVGIFLGAGILLPGIYFSSNMQEYNGKAAARRAEGQQ